MDEPLQKKEMDLVTDFAYSLIHAFLHLLHLLPDIVYTSPISHAHNRAHHSVFHIHSIHFIARDWIRTSSKIN
jgi:hypothetical protein